MDTDKTINHLSLCTGYEGIGMGLRNIWPNVREIAYVEIEAFAVANLAAKIEEGWIHPTPIYTSLKTFPFKILSWKSGYPFCRIPVPTL